MKTITVSNTCIKPRINSKKWTYAETNWIEGIIPPRNEPKLQVTVYHILNVPDDVTLQSVRDMYDAIPMRMTPFFFQQCLSFGIEYTELVKEYDGHRTSIHVNPISSEASKEFYALV